jgi:hypothetical protein
VTRPERPEFTNEAIVDARPEEQAMSWYYYLESKLTFPFRAMCVAANAVSPLRKSETIEVLRMATRMPASTTCSCKSAGRGERWRLLFRNSIAINSDESTEEAIGNWHYWVAQGYCL